MVVGIPSLSRQRLQEISADAFAARAEIAFVPQLSFGSETPTDYVDIDGVLIASLSQHASKRLYEAGKRMFDLVATLSLLGFTAPLWAAIAILIRRDSKGPVLFRQMRVGRGGKLFELYKFRSMHVDAPKYDLHPTGTEDPRVTKVGSWLRRTSFDELPQLINVLKGDMSLVGPRPEMPFIVERYTARHWQRLSVIPGLTGLWQISADRAFLDPREHSIRPVLHPSSQLLYGHGHPSAYGCIRHEGGVGCLRPGIGFLSTPVVLQIRITIIGQESGSSESFS